MQPQINYLLQVVKTPRTRALLVMAIIVMMAIFIGSGTHAGGG